MAQLIGFLLLAATATILSLDCARNAALALDNNLALTPPMGWLTWEHFTCVTDCQKYPDQCVSGRLIRQTADIMSASYLEFGYKYINIDDCWSNMKRNPITNRLIPDTERFGGDPGLRDLTEYVHKKGLLMGIYGDCGVATCGGYPAQLKSEANYEDNYFDTDAETFANWGIDSFKFDGCNIDPFKAESICPGMSRAIQDKKRPTVLICEWPWYMFRQDPSRSINWTLAMESCNVVRYWDDVHDSWQSIMNIVDITIKLQDVIKVHHGPGHWFDPDQLVIGNYGLSLEQARAQMAIWSVWAAPLYMGNDLRNIDPEMVKILTNKKLIKINQDRLGVFGLMVAQKESSTNETMQAFVKPVEPVKNGCPSFAVVYLNRATLGTSEYMSFKIRDLFVKSAIEVAAERYYQLYPPGSRGEREFSAKDCIKRFSHGIKAKQSKGTTFRASSRPIDKAQHWKVEDLILENQLDDVSLDSSLDLEVNPNGVRAVLLTEK